MVLACNQECRPNFLLCLIKVHVSVYVYRYTYLKYFLLQVLPLYQRVPMYVYLYLHPYLVAISFTAAVPSLSLGGRY